MTTPPYVVELVAWLIVSSSYSPFHAKAPHPDDARRHPRTLELWAWHQSPSCTSAVDESADHSMTIIRSAVVTHPPFAVSREQMRPDGFRSGFPERARRINQSATPARNFIDEHVSRLRRVQDRVANARCGNFRARRGSQNETDHSRANAEA